MEVHIVVMPSSDQEEGYIAGAFSSPAKAKKFIRNQFDRKQPVRPYFESIIVDNGAELPAKTFATEYHVCLSCRDPLPVKPVVQTARIEVVAGALTEYAKFVEIDYKQHGGRGAYANGYSLKGGEEALKLARKARRQWLKDHPEAKVRRVAQNIG